VLIISQHARLLHLPFPRHTVYRLNAAWIKSVKELDFLLKKIKNDIFLDFPQGRTKPPKPVLALNDMIEAMHKNTNIKYFAITNVKKPEQIDDIREKVPSRIKLVPKIESKSGIDNLEKIFKKLKRGERHIMLDKEDLYNDMGSHKELFERYVEKALACSKKKRISVLELQGVIFSDEMPRN
jgi:hypothetical protein